MEAVREALVAVGLPPDSPVERTTGATGELWKVVDGPFALRLVPSGASVEGVLAAMAAAGSAGLPVPEALRRGDWSGGHALLFAWLPGSTVPDYLARDPESACEIGRMMGVAQAVLHGVRAPAGVADVKERPFGPPLWPLDSSGLPDGDALLHLDWHPLNVLVDGGRLTAALDWDNARAGHPLADLARTYTLLTVDPSLASLLPMERASVDLLAAGWADGYGPLARSIPPECLAWAGRAMLRDLDARYSAAELEPLRSWTESHSPT